jgi:hypothetical protein
MNPSKEGRHKEKQKQKERKKERKNNKVGLHNALVSFYLLA